MRRFGIVLLAVVLILTLFSACTSTPQESSAVTESSESQSVSESSEEVSESSTESLPEESPEATQLRIGTTSPQEAFSILLTNGAVGRMNYNSFTNLSFLQWDENNQLAPNFMQTWEFAEDGLSLTFTFPTDLFWHDGLPVTSEDVQFSLEYAVNTMSAGQPMTGCEIVDDHTVKILFSEPAGLSFLTGMSSTGNNSKVVMPKHIWENVEDYENYLEADAIIGCGPYKFVSLDKDAQIAYYEAVDYPYFKGEIKVKEVSVKTYDNNDALLMALANGEIDAIYNYSNGIEPAMLDIISNVPEVDPGMSDNTANYMINFGCDTDPCGDVNFRKAVAYALDYPLMAETTGGEYAQISGWGIIPPPNKAFDASLPKMEQDQEESKRILDEAGYLDVDGDGFRELPDGTPMDVMVTVNSGVKMEMYGRIFEIMKQDMEDVGVKIHFDEEAANNAEVLNQRRNEPGQCEISLLQCTTGVAPFGSAYRYLLSSSNMAVGTCPDEAMNTSYQEAMNAKDYDTYDRFMTEVQQRNAEVVAGIAISWDKAFFPYRTDSFEGWINYPGWGVINGQTWYNITVK